jgi:enoyl-[acyl-carrier protein] reductase III
VLAAVAASTDRLDQLVHCAVKVIPEPLLSINPVALTEAIKLNGTAIVYLAQAARPLFRPGSTVFFCPAGAAGHRCRTMLRLAPPSRRPRA